MAVVERLHREQLGRFTFLAKTGPGAVSDQPAEA
jgi:hypothetical protein